MARVRTSVSLGTVAVVVLGGLSLGLGSVMMPSSASLGGPVVLSERPAAQLPLTADAEPTTEPTSPPDEATTTEAVGVRPPSPVRADGSRPTSPPATGDTGTRSRTSGVDTSTSGSDAPTTKGLATTGTSTGDGPAHAPAAPSRSDDLRDTVTTSDVVTTDGASEDTHSHTRP
ncbi:hypothetical protein [Cellulomonas sp. P24]|uniref:hypothetical protein n=1 Tax=Cellulomonas sp. P24 TaxID=2885206 RepID=UPI00216B133A|nr:hypothetical protein [Cellulomonas sp. P24]MCR6492298.1 hypothetical protein [Cellulomonas sp. P24]